jgi:hypothetical protein
MGQSRRTKQAAASPDVRFTPIATKPVRRNEVMLCAITGREQMQQIAVEARVTRSPRRRGRAMSPALRGQAPAQ